MKIQTSVGEVNLRFAYDKKINPKRTKAFISINGELVGEGFVKKSKEDAHHKEKARRAALTKAMMSINNKTLRGEIWSTFLNRFQKVTTRSQMAV